MSVDRVHLGGILVAGLVLCLAWPAQAQLVWDTNILSNGGFETGDLTESCKRQTQLIN